MAFLLMLSLGMAGAAAARVLEGSNLGGDGAILTTPMGWGQLLLGVAGVALMAVTVVVVVLAFIGWGALKNEAKSTATSVASQVLNDFLAEENIRKMIREEVLREAGLLYNDMEQSPTHEASELLKEKDND